MKLLKILVVFIALVILATNVMADPYANAVKSEWGTVVDGINAIGAPDGNVAVVYEASTLRLDMGLGEEIYGYAGDDDFIVIEQDGIETVDCAKIAVEASEDGLVWVGMSCDSNSLSIPDGQIVRYVRIRNLKNQPHFEVDALVAHYYMPDHIPEFGAIGAGLALLGAGAFILKKRKK